MKGRHKDRQKQKLGEKEEEIIIAITKERKTRERKKDNKKRGNVKQKEIK